MSITEATKKLVVKLESENAQERYTAVDVLSKKHDSQIIQLLISLLETDTSIYFREGACKILGKLKAKEALDELVSCLSDPDEGVNFHAAVALSNINESKAVKPILEILNQKTIDPVFKSELIIALGNFGDNLAVDPLISILRYDKDIFVRHEAARALGKIGNQKAIGALSEVAKKDKDNQLHYLALNAINTIFEKEN
ncbi:MAG TPA: HEAT repeat domain-containing protein [Candidatus Bathyarchaeia archaeon]|nr:HEAT repeat domain-containing protein [Candidatus Bathyarchaeia archaeon]